MEAPAPSRPRVEGRREEEIFAAALSLIAESGYDRLTLDAVAARARASKATLYRRWSGKADLVADAVCRISEGAADLPDTGSLRGDLLALAEHKGMLDPGRADVLCGLATAMYHDQELGDLLRARTDDPRTRTMHALFERGIERGEVRPDADLDLLGTVVQALVIYHLTYESPGRLEPGFIERVIDHVIVPAARAVPVGRPTGCPTDPLTG